MAAPEREFVSSRNEDDGHAWAYSRTRDAEMADLRPAPHGLGQNRPCPSGVQTSKGPPDLLLGLCPNRSSLLKMLERGRSPSLRFSHRAFAAQ